MGIIAGLGRGMPGRRRTGSRRDAADGCRRRRSPGPDARRRTRAGGPCPGWARTGCCPDAARRDGRPDAVRAPSGRRGSRRRRRPGASGSAGGAGGSSAFGAGFGPGLGAAFFGRGRGLGSAPGRPAPRRRGAAPRRAPRGRRRGRRRPSWPAAFLAGPCRPASRRGAARAEAASVFSLSPYSLRKRISAGSSTVELADLTNSPISLNFSRTNLLSTPNSLASS